MAKFVHYKLNDVDIIYRNDYKAWYVLSPLGKQVLLDPKKVSMMFKRMEITHKKAGDIIKNETQ